MINGILTGWGNANDNDKELIIEKISSLAELRQKKFGDKVINSTSSPSEDTSKSTVVKQKSLKKAGDEKEEKVTYTGKNKKITNKEPKKIGSKKGESKANIPMKIEQLELNGAEDNIQKSLSKFDSFTLFCKLCDVISSVSKYSEKTKAVEIFINKGMV